MPKRKPKLAVWKFTSCDGCQLSLLDCEDALLELGDAVTIAHFLEAARGHLRGPYDLSIIEGSITTAADIERIRDIRRKSKRLVAIGACATAGGIQALRNFRDVREMTEVIYARPDYIDTLSTSTAISEHVQVDFELQGCPPNKEQLLEVIGALLAGRAPQIEAGSVCMQCKRAGNVCVMVAHGTPCLGPVTHAGCGALCPTYARGCYGCFGPQPTVNSPALNRWLRPLGAREQDLVRIYRSFYAHAPPFTHASQALESGQDGEAPTGES